MPSGEYGIALQAASYNSNGKVVSLLLEKDADVNAYDGSYVQELFCVQANKNCQKIVCALSS
jgi:hypothetical protein